MAGSICSSSITACGIPLASHTAARKRQACARIAIRDITRRSPINCSGTIATERSVTCRSTRASGVISERAWGRRSVMWMTMDGLTCSSRTTPNRISCFAIAAMARSRTLLRRGVWPSTSSAQPVSAMGADLRDIDNDGRLDFFVTDLANEGFLLFRHAGTHFDDVSDLSGITVATLAVRGLEQSRRGLQQRRLEGSVFSQRPRNRQRRIDPGPTVPAGQCRCWSIAETARSETCRREAGAT